MFSDEAPTLFILFILSHGYADGKIATDTKIPHEGEPREVEYETFSTKSVFEALKANAFIKDTLKLLFLGVSFENPNLYYCTGEGSY